MRRVSFHIVLVLAGPGILSHNRAGFGQLPPTPAYHLTAIRAFIFWNGEGTFSDNVVQDQRGSVSLWNTSSEGTLVVVEVQGQRGSYVPGRKIQLVARANGKVILDQTFQLGLFSDVGRYFASFWLYNARCIPVTLRAHVLGQTDSTSVQGIIPFGCGE